MPGSRRRRHRPPTAAPAACPLQDDQPLNRLLLGKLLRSVSAAFSLLCSMTTPGRQTGHATFEGDARCGRPPVRWRQCHARCTVPASATLAPPFPSFPPAPFPCLQLNLHVLEAQDGEQACQTYLRYGRSVAFIFLDLMMPVLDGFGAALSIRRWGVWVGAAAASWASALVQHAALSVEVWQLSSHPSFAGTAAAATAATTATCPRREPAPLPPLPHRPQPPQPPRPPSLQR